MNTATSFLLLVLVGLSACAPSLTPFTQKLADQNRWDERELKKIQFYLSTEIVLRRKATEGSTRIENGKIKMINGEKIEEVIIPRGTSGVFLFSPKDKRYAISFENSDPPKYLIFGPNPKLGERYALLAKDWTRNQGIITYDEKEYYTTSESAYAYLLVDLKRARKLDLERREAQGRKVEE